MSATVETTSPAFHDLTGHDAAALGFSAPVPRNASPVVERRSLGAPATPLSRGGVALPGAVRPDFRSRRPASGGYGHGAPGGLPGLNERYQVLRRKTGALRLREAALRMGSTEAALVAAGAAGPAIPLRPDWAALISALPTLGRVMALTRNDHAVHERCGQYRDVEIGSGHILVLGEEIDLRLFPTRWAHAFAVGGERPTIQIFDRMGTAAHKVLALSGQTDMGAWHRLVAAFACPGLPAPAPRAVPQKRTRERPVDSSALRSDWLALRDAHDFTRLLRAHRATRSQAFRLVGEDLALPLQAGAGNQALRLAAAQEVPLMIFVASRGAIQIHAGKVEKLHDTRGWFNVLDPDFNLHLHAQGIVGAWRVVKPSVDGAVTSIELLDASGCVAAQIFGDRKDGQPESEEWRRIAGTITSDCALGAGFDPQLVDPRLAGPMMGSAD